jgi:hypothetical protein
MVGFKQMRFNIGFTPQLSLSAVEAAAHQELTMGLNVH